MQTNTPKIITTSWDDGHPLDGKVAELLAKYGLKGTFYVPASNSEHPVMSLPTLAELAKNFELGGHTKNHVVLTQVSPDVAAREITGCREWLGDVLGSAPVCFCYPQGKLNSSIVGLVRSSGFHYARTVEFSRIDLKNMLLAPTTAQVFNHTKLSFAKNLVKRANVRGVELLFRVKGFETRLVDVVEYWLGRLQREGGIFHLWGHSWEIEQHNLWNELEEVLRMLSHRDGYSYCTNGELLAYGKK